MGTPVIDQVRVFEQHDTDGRRRTVTLTRAGVAEWGRLDRESERAAAGLVTPLSASRQEQLAAALRTANRLLAVATIHFDPVDPGHPQARAAVDGYFAELGHRFPGGFARRLLAELEQQAASLGYSSVVLDTNGVLTEAIALYESSGYQPTERYNDNPYAQRWFRKALH